MERVAEGYAFHVAVPLAASLLVLVAVTGALLIRDSHRREKASPGLQALKRGDSARWQFAALVVTLVFLAANQLLVRGAAAGIWDVDGQFYPYFVFVADHVRAGRFVSWDAWSNGGLPILGDPQLGAFSPIVNLLGLIFGGTSLGFRAYWLLVWWAGGMGMLLLGRHLGSPPWGACAVALGFLFCGVYTGNAEHTPWIAAYSFLPFIIWRLDRALQCGRLFPAVEAGALWGLSGLAGYPGLVVLTGSFCGLWTLGRWALRSDKSAPGGTDEMFRGITVRHAIVSLAVVAMVGAVVISPTYISFFHEGAGMHSRVGALTREEALTDALDPGAMASLASPYLPTFKVRQPELWPASDVSMVNIYVGAVVPVLALFGLLRRPRARWRWWLVGLAALSLTSAVGEALPLRGWLYDWFYPTRFFRHSAIFRLYFVFTLCVLALLATRDLVTDSRTIARRPRGTLLTAAVVAAVLALVTVVPFFGSEWEAGLPHGAVLLGRAHAFAVWGAIVIVAVVTYARPAVVRSHHVAIVLVALSSADALLTNTISIPTMLRIGAHRELWRTLDAAHSPSLDLTAQGLRRLPSACGDQRPEQRCRRNDQMITKVPVFDAYASERNPYQMASAQSPVLRGAATGADRIWFSPHVTRVAPTEAAFASFVARAESLGAVPLVIHEPSALLARRSPETSAGVPLDTAAARQISGLPAAQRVPASVIAYSPNELVLDVVTEADGWLLVTDRWARGWNVEVNGWRRPLYGANFIFRAAPVTAGANRVQFTFHPLAVPWLVILSWGVLAGVAVTSAGAARRLKRQLPPVE